MTLRRACRVAATVAATVVAALLVAGSNGVSAHHAWNEINTTRSTTLVGTVRTLKWENPHASLVFATTGEGGAPVEWTVLMSGIARMEARGVDAATVAVGQTLTIVGSPARDAAHVIRANRIRAGDIDHVLY